MMMIKPMFSRFFGLFFYLPCFINSVSSLEGINVRPVQGNQYPFVVAIAHKPEFRPPVEDFHFCGGALISKRHVLTATHCFERERFNELQVIARLSDVTTDNSVTFEVDSICTYDEWLKFNNLPPEMFVDTSILKLKVQDTKIIPAPYIGLRASDQLREQSVTLIGFGVGVSNFKTLKLMEATSKILEGAECLQKMRSFSPDYEEIKDLDGLICTKTKPWVLFTDGDSGGPLLTDSGAVLGVNFATCPSIDFCPPKSKTVNVANRVIHFKDFIESMISL